MARDFARDVVLESVEDFGFDFAIGGVDDAAVRSVGESGDFFVYVGDGLVEVLRGGGSGEVKEVKEVDEVKERMAGETVGRI